MTTLAELIDTDPDPSWGYPVSELSYGSGTWRFAFMIADQGAGASVEWHDLTAPVSELTWARGSTQPRGRFQAVEPSVLINATDDTYAPWNPDTSSVFGSHVPLRAGRLLMRASVFRVVDAAVDLHLPLFTARVRRWGDAQAGEGGYRYHRVDGIDLMSYLVQAPIGSQVAEGWYSRISDLLTDADWPFGSTIHGAQTVDAATTLTLSDQAASDSAITAIDASLDPVGITWRTTPAGELLAHPFPWDTFHADIFAGAGTIVGTEYTAAIETYHPGGPTFAYDAGVDEVQFITEVEGGSFGVNSDIENVANEWQITHPVVTTNLDSGYTTSAYDDAVSSGRYGRRAIPAASWLAENDTVQQDLVDEFAYTDLVAAPLTVDIRHHGVFPAIAVLDHYDPCTIRHASKPGRTEVTVSGPLRQVAHTIRKWGPNLLWEAVIQVDIDAESTSSPLNPVTGLAVTSPVPDTYAEFDWTNPSQTVTPTGTQVRLIGESTQWIDLPYAGVGAAGFDWLFLQPSTYYEFEVRLIREVDGNVTHTSPVRSVAFSTAAPAEPIPSDDGETITIPADPAGTCDEVDWKLESSTNGSSWTLVDSGDEADFTTVDGEQQLDLSAQVWTNGLLYRVCTRTACDPPGVGSYVCSTEFQPACATPAQLSSAPFNDANLKLFVPQVCGATIEDAVSDLPVSIGPSFGGVGYDDDSNYVLLSSSSGGVVCYGESANLPLTDGDRSIHWRGKIDTATPEDILFRVGRLRIAIIDVGSSVYKFAAIKSFSGGSITAIGTTTVASDTEYDVYATWDRDTATVAIIVDGTEEDTTEDAASYVNTPNLPTFSARLPANSWCTELAAWDSVVAVSGWTPADATLAFWYDGVDSVSGSSLLDLSGNGLTLTKSGTVTTGGSPLNGHNTLQHAGGYYSGATAADWKFLHYNAVTTILAVVKFGNSSNPGTFYGLLGSNGTSSGNVGVSVYYDDDAANDRLSIQITRGSIGLPVRSVLRNDAVTPNGWHLLLFTFDPATSTYAARIRNVQIDDDTPAMTESGTATESSSNPSTAMALGATNAAGVGALTGGIAEIVGVVGVGDDVIATFNYLNTKYGLGLTPL